MLLSATIAPNLSKFVWLGLIIIGLGVVLRYFRQPYVIAYILAGVLLGEHGFEIITDQTLITGMGEFGLILLLFFIGMELSLPNFLKNWKLATIGTSLQVVGSVLMVGIIGILFNWPFSRIVTLGFVISLSSSAVVIKLLQDKNETHTAIGQNVISILLMQDILIVPMLIVTSYLGGTVPPITEISIVIISLTLLISPFWIAITKKIVKI